MTPEGDIETTTVPIAAVKRGMEEQITEYLTDHPAPQTRAAILSNLTGDTTLRKKTLTAMKRAKTVVVDEMQKPPLYSLNSEPAGQLDCMDLLKKVQVSPAVQHPLTLAGLRDFSLRKVQQVQL